MGVTVFNGNNKKAISSLSNDLILDKLTSDSTRPRDVQKLRKEAIKRGLKL